MMKGLAVFVGTICGISTVAGAGLFDQLGELLPPPSETRLASGAPGPDYWQQEANYQIEVELDEDEAMIRGSETIEYINHSPHELSFVWVQLDQNLFAKDSTSNLSDQPLNWTREHGEAESVSERGFRRFLYQEDFEGGHRVLKVADADDEALPYQIVDTNMRIDLPETLESGESLVLKIDWEYPIVDEAFARRTGRKELEGGDYVYQIAQWYPRMCAYYDLEGWQTKPYIGNGEFALEFGTFEVEITVPEDFIVAATGELTNGAEVLSSEQRDLLEEAETSQQPLVIVAAEEAAAKLESPAEGTKTWKFAAEQVRDFAFAASRGYIWDAVGVEIEDETVMAMSVYPKEAAPIWARFSTDAVRLTLESYSEIVYPYPYPVAWSAWGPVGGMEYPMVSFQSSWDIDEKETYPEGVRNYLITVVVHEVGHFWFPMIINSDERQWQWLDEGLNTFVEDRSVMNFDPRVKERYKRSVQNVMNRMEKSDDPIIMMDAHTQTSRGYQSYTKPALGLTLLRETIVGPEVFDFAFREYARRWAFKRATPSDFFRTMEDASGKDLDWFWRQWFYGNDHIDLSIDSVEAFVLGDGNPERSAAMKAEERAEMPDTPDIARLENQPYYVDDKEWLQDWYYTYDEHAVEASDVEDYEKSLEDLENWQREQLDFNDTIYIVKVRNVGGLTMPFSLDLTFEDGSGAKVEIPVEVWRRGDEVVSVPLVSNIAVSSVVLDKDNKILDTDLDNNVFPRPIRKSRFEIDRGKDPDNPMREALYPDDDEEEESEESED